MARWQDLVDSEPAFAQAVQARFDANRHKLLGTLRKDGSPRISGIETTFKDGDVWLGMMPESMKLKDLQRDPRYVLHTSSEDPGENGINWSGDAKISGCAEEVTDPQERRRVLQDAPTAGYAPEDVPLFRLEIDEAVVLRIGEPADHMVVELWRPGQPLKSTRRA
jgi:Pyridoxamine 5'-phosphate oxidase